MKKYNIPTAAYENFDNAEDAIKYLKEQASFPIVLKADGLALGKGVLICNTLGKLWQAWMRSCWTRNSVRLVIVWSSKSL